MRMNSQIIFKDSLNVYTQETVLELHNTLNEAGDKGRSFVVVTTENSKWMIVPVKEIYYIKEL